MQYDPVKFKELQGRQIRVRRAEREAGIRGNYAIPSELDSIVDPWQRLAASIIYQAVADLKAARRGATRPEAAALAHQLGFDSVVLECKDYFHSFEFEDHCALAGADPAYIRQGVRL